MKLSNLVRCFIILALLSVAGCMTCSKKPEELTPAMSFQLSPSTLEKVTNRANNGDKDAALRLFEHYSFGFHDNENGDYWLKKAAKLGNVEAKRYLEIRAEKEKTHKGNGNGGVIVPSPFDK